MYTENELNMFSGNCIQLKDFAAPFYKGDNSFKRETTFFFTWLVAPLVFETVKKNGGHS